MCRYCEYKPEKLKLYEKPESYKFYLINRLKS